MSPETFRELLDEATDSAPPPRGVGVDLAAGRTMLRRRRAVEAGAGLAALALVAVTTGTALTGSHPASDRPAGFATDPPSAPTETRVDPAILSDVIDAAFPTPGAAQLRNIRVQTFVHGWGLERCGGTAAPIDSTADRFEQDVLPNLELIRERGFTEPTQESFRGVDEDCQLGDELEAAAPAWGEWRELVGPWLDLVDETLLDPELVALKEPMAGCLRQATGLEIDDEDPVDSLFGASDGATDREQRQHAVAFADCGADYFGLLEELLLDQRPALVEQHRDVLEEFARQVASLGYSS